MNKLFDAFLTTAVEHRLSPKPTPDPDQTWRNKDGYKLFSMFGVPCRADITLILVALVLTFVCVVTQNYDVLTIFAFVLPIGLMHEYAHIAVAKKLNVKCSKVIMSAFGGLAFIDENASKKETFLITLAGPLANFTAFLIFGTLNYFFNGSWLTESKDVLVLDVLVLLNLVFAIFNMIPALPLDGGHIAEYVSRKIFKPKSERKFTLIVHGFSAVIGLTLLGLSLYWGYIFGVIIGFFMTGYNLFEIAILNRIHKMQPQP